MIDNIATKLLLKGWSCDTCSERKKSTKKIGQHCYFFKHRPKMNICGKVTKFEQPANNITFTTCLPMKISLVNGEAKEQIDVQNA